MNDMTLSIFKVILISLKNIYNILVRELKRLHENQYKSIKIYNIIHDKRYFISCMIFFYWKILYNTQKYHEFCVFAWSWIWNIYDYYDIMNISWDIVIDFCNLWNSLKIYFLINFSRILMIVI